MAVGHQNQLRAELIRAAIAPAADPKRKQHRSSLPSAYDASWSGNIDSQRPAGFSGSAKLVRVSYTKLYSNVSGRYGKELVFWLAHTSAYLLEKGSHNSSSMYRSAILDFGKFLHDGDWGCAITAPRDITNSVLERFQRWLREQTNNAGTLRKRYANFVLLLFYLRLLKPGLLRADLDLSHIAQRAVRRGRTKHSSRADEAKQLSMQDGARLEKAFLLHCQAYYRHWRIGQKLMKEARSRGCDPRDFNLTPTTSLGEGLLKAHHILFIQGGPLPLAFYRQLHTTIYGIREKNTKPHQLTPGRKRASPRRNRSGVVGRRDERLPIWDVSNVEEFFGYIAPGYNDLFPFLALIAARTYANSSSLCTFPLNCFEPPAKPKAARSRIAPTDVDAVLRTPPLEQTPNRDHVWWEKNRPIPKWKHRSFPTGADNLPPAIIRQVIEITEPIRSYAPKEIRSFLFIVRKERLTGPDNTSRIGHYYASTIGEALRTFRRRNPALPYFHYKILRLRGSDASYAASGGNIFIGQHNLGHANAQTTYTNYMGRHGRRINETIIARFQYYLQELLTFSKLPGALSPDFKPKSAAIAPANATQLSEVVSPLAELARQLSHAFTLSNLIFHGEHERCARLLQFADHLLSQQRPDNIIRWAAAVGPVHRFLTTDLLKRFSPEVLAKARLHIPHLPPLPAFE
jgi:hypothetical protein